MHLVTRYDCNICLFDVNNNFLHIILKYEVYMEIFLEFGSIGGTNKMCRMRKTLYRVEQSPQTWLEN